MYKIRLKFSKTGAIKFISHLDLMATLRRGLIRAGAELQYTQGFNPHPVMSYALPLPVGHESVCELTDIALTKPLPPITRLNACFPDGIEILEAYEPSQKFAKIEWVEFCGKMFYDSGNTDFERVAQRYAADSIVITKKTKRGESDVDIVPKIRDIEFFENGEFSAKISGISPANFIAALADDAPDYCNFRRVEVFDDGMNVFR